MAKISRKPPGANKRPGNDIMEGFGFGPGPEDSGVLFEPEPITHSPCLDMYSNSAELVIEVEMPGVRKEEIDVTLCKNVISIKALKYECFDEDKINYVCMERAFGRLFRAVEIPFPVDTARIKAECKNGILRITVPRVEDKRAVTKRVLIESAD